MTGLTDRTAQGLLGHITGKAAIFPMPSSYVALFTAAGNDAGTGFTEVTGGAYARASTTAAAWNAPSGSSPSQITNAQGITFAISTSDWGSIVAFGLYDAPTAGNLIAWDYFGSFAWLPTQISAASPAVFSASQHGYLAGDSVIFSTEYGGVSPSFSQGNFTGILTVQNPLTDTFSVNNAGTVVNTSSSGNGMVRKIVRQQIIAGVQPTFPIASLILTSA
jgi:hypothetical protein